MKRHAKAPSFGSTTHYARGLAALAVACVAFLGIGASTAMAEETECPNEAVRIEQNSTALPNCRAYEMVSPIDKHGGDIMPSSPRVHAAADGSALVFNSLTGFADLQAMEIDADYMSERTGLGPTGWSTHAISPLQSYLSARGVLTEGQTLYDAEFTPDLTKGVYRVFGSLPGDANVQNVSNLYLREDLRTSGPGQFQLLSSSVSSPDALLPERPKLAGASTDLSYITFESPYNLTSDAPPQTFVFCVAYGLACKPRVYEWDHGELRFAGVLPDGASAEESVEGRGEAGGHHSPHATAADGSRLFFMTRPNPFKSEGELYARIGGAVTVHLNHSEKTSPESPLPVEYWDASANGTSVFFTTEEGLVDGDNNNSNDLYMWKQADHDQTQQVAVDATGGSFTLSLYGRTTEPIPHDATAPQVQSALTGIRGPAPVERLVLPAGDVKVTGAAGGPFQVTFEGSLAGVDMPELVADSSALTGGAATATVVTTTPVQNLTRLSQDTVGEDEPGVQSVIGASADGSYVYFTARSALVPGADEVGDFPGYGAGIYLWHEGDLRYVGWLRYLEDAIGLNASTGQPFAITRLARASRVSPDGTHLLFASHSDEGLAGRGGFTGADQGTNCNLDPNMNGGCRELYLYDATTGSLECASCRVGAPAAGDALDMTTESTGATPATYHPSQALSDNGRYVFFNTVDALVPEDTNGAQDVYVYDSRTKTQSLISSGLDSGDSYFMDASASGDDVFFTTREALTGWDGDGNIDVYDARVGGGFSEPPPTIAPCQGDACRSAAPVSIPAPTPGSTSLQGPGNPKPIHCPRGKRPVRRAGKTTCVKRHRRKHQRHANPNRRIAR